MTFPKQNNFDLLRLFAALQVMVYHLFAHFGILDNIGLFSIFLQQFPGVPIFFFISGFLITSSYNNNKANLAKFFKNRAFRIFPALWVCLIFTIVLLQFFNQIDWHNIDFYKWIVAQMTFLQFYTPELLRNWGIGTPNGSLWSIVVELQFYVLLPVICWLLNKQNSITNINIILLIIFSSSFFLNYFLNSNYSNNPFFDSISLENQKTLFYVKIVSTTVFWYLYYFIIGIFFYYNFNTIKRFFENKALIWLSIYFLYILIFAIYKQQYLSPYFYNIYAQIALCILAFTTFSVAFSNNGLADKLLRKNDISYGIYIYHMPIINTIIALNIKGTIFKFLISSIIVINLAIISWVFIERKAMLLKNKIK